MKFCETREDFVYRQYGWLSTLIFSKPQQRGQCLRQWQPGGQHHALPKILPMWKSGRKRYQLGVHYHRDTCKSCLSIMLFDLGISRALSSHEIGSRDRSIFDNALAQPTQSTAKRNNNYFFGTVNGLPIRATTERTLNH